jgi:type II secretory ATPase GspE/PulE/Tfp pilus assembly ATPase PilB-like protein
MLAYEEESLIPIINEVINKKYGLKDGYSNLIANEQLYSQFVQSLGYEYYDSYNDLSENYLPIIEKLDEEKLHLCIKNHVLPLEDKRTKNKILAIRDIANTNFKVLNQFYFMKIIILGTNLLSEIFTKINDTSLDEINTKDDDDYIDEYLNKILSQAILMGASDIHIQKMNQSAFVWFRIDGVKIDIGTMKITTAKILKRKLVTLANQEDSDFDSINGIISYLDGHKEVKFRLGVINSKLNFTVTLRLIGGKMVVSSDLKELNYPSPVVEVLENLIKFDNGMVLITGQVGSGKTHLMYALLKQLAQKRKYIVTIENPVEYVDDAFFQIDLSEHESASLEHQYSYPQAVVDILRQDSNIILIGETREPQTAFQLVNAANLGQLVFSTMHTNSARGTVSRMISSLGIQKGDIVDELRGIVAQKLVRKLCSNCKLSDGEGGYKKNGCEQCNNTGFKNRVPVVEVIRFKLSGGGDFEDPAEYITLEEGTMLQYRAGFVSKEDALSIINGKELWFD